MGQMAKIILGCEGSVMAAPLAIAATGASVLGGVMGFKGARAVGQAQQAAAEYNAQVAENEKVLVARQNRDESRLRKQSERLIGAQVNAASASGVEISGSTLMPIADVYYGTAADAARIQYNAEINKQKLQAQADIARAEGQARRAASDIQATASLLGGVKAVLTSGSRQEYSRNGTDSHLAIRAKDRR